MSVIKAGLVLEGGGMRGLFTAGVLDCFMDHELYFKDCFGVSAGANHGCNYLSKQRGRSLEIVEKYLNTKQYASPQALLFTGNFFDKKFHTNILPNYLVPYDYKTANRAEMNLYVVVTECESGKPVYKKIENVRKDLDWIWASGSLPLLAKTVELNGKHYLDGGISDSIPVQYAQNSGNDKVVVVLTRDITYRKKTEGKKLLIQTRYHKYPNMIRQLKTRPENYNNTLDKIQQQEKNGKLFVIRPEKPVMIGRLEKDIQVLKDLYLQGYEQAEKSMDAMFDYLQS